MFCAGNGPDFSQGKAARDREEEKAENKNQIKAGWLVAGEKERRKQRKARGYGVKEV